MYKFIDIFCNIMIVLLCIYIIVAFVISGMSKTQIDKFDGEIITSFVDLTTAQAIVEKYIYRYTQKEYKDFEVMLDKFIQKDESVYTKITDSIEDSEVYISNVEKSDDDNYLIEYNLKNKETERMLVKLDENTTTFKIYYDSMLAEY